MNICSVSFARPFAELPRLFVEGRQNHSCWHGSARFGTVSIKPTKVKYIFMSLYQNRAEPCRTVPLQNISTSSFSSDQSAFPPSILGICCATSADMGSHFP